LKHRRNQSGMLTEAISSLMMFIPLLVVVILVTIQATQAYLIAKNMSRAAQIAARSLAEEYKSNSQIVSDSSAQQAIFNDIRIPQMVSSNQQFYIPPTGWQTTVEPKTVTVVVTYISGVGSPANPAYPNPNILNLSSAFRISADSTFRIAQ
jgi:archaellum component FlaG (FlaF/FlaG flagellin family)